jgi:hypothetical protein
MTTKGNGLFGVEIGGKPFDHAAFIEMAKAEAMKPSGPAMDHEPTAKFIRGEYHRLNFGKLD